MCSHIELSLPELDIFMTKENEKSKKKINLPNVLYFVLHFITTVSLDHL